MADSGIPFGIDASNVPLVEDLVDIPVGQGFRVDVLLTDLLAGDDPTSATLAIKASPSASDIALTTIIKIVTPTLSAAGVLSPTDDPTVWRATFLLTRSEGVRLRRLSTYTYTVVAVVDRDGTSYSRMVQRGALRVTLYPIDDDSPLADGAFYADGTQYASGFYS